MSWLTLLQRNIILCQKEQCLSSSQRLHKTNNSMFHRRKVRHSDGIELYRDG